MWWNCLIEENTTIREGHASFTTTLSDSASAVEIVRCHWGAVFGEDLWQFPVWFSLANSHYPTDAQWWFTLILD